MCYRNLYDKCLILTLLSTLWSPPLAEAAIAIDEVLADPPSGSKGDANQDGVRQSYADEFIELVNTGADTVSLAGWRLGDDDAASLFTFPDSTRLPPGGRLLLFGGGTPSGFTVPVFADDGRIGNGLTNGGDVIILFDAAADTVDRVELASWPKDQSIVRTDSGIFAPHKSTSSVGELFSPGRAVNAAATPLAPTAAPPEPEQAPANADTTTQVDASTDPIPAPPAPRPRPNYPILISEILADPPSGLSGDANRDGHRNSYEDEFVEIHNSGPTTISLAGWRLGDDDIKPDAYFRFPDDAILKPGAYVVLFGGGAPTGFADDVFADDGRIGNGLTNAGDRLLLLDAAADTVLDFAFTSKGNIDQALVRKNDQYQLHSQLPGRGLYSPGQAQTEYTSFAIPDPQLSEGNTQNLILIGRHPTGLDTLDAKDFQWLSVDPHIAQIRPSAKIRGLRPGHTRVECWRDALFLAQQPIRIHPLDPPNDPPQITSQPDTTAFAGGWYRYLIHATDPEHNTLVFTFAQAPRWLDLDNLSGLIQGRAPDTTGTFNIAFEAADGRGGLAAQHYRLHLIPRPTIRIDEVLADPPSGMRGDANQDGYRHTYEDEFVELYNAGQTPVDLGGCRLVDLADKPFTFPAPTLLPPDGRAVVFGGGTPRGPLAFSAGGRIGDGLGNRRDALYLIGPQSRDTLASLVYDLRRDPDQSLLGDGQTLHAAWPGRAPFSPGTSRPLLQSLRPNHHKLNLVRGEHRQLHLFGRYSDGGEYPISTDATWTSAAPAIATISNNGALTAIDTGTCQLSVHLDDFAIRPHTVTVKIRQSLATSLRFTPLWDDASINTTKPQTFIVRSDHPDKQSYTWSLNGHRLPIMALQYLHTPNQQQTDTIRVEIHRSFETTSRQWILHPPAAKPLANDQLLQVLPNPFNATTSLRFHLASASSVHLSLYNLQGQRIRILTDAPFNAGAHQVVWDGLNQRGHPAATGLYLARLITPTTHTHTKLLLIR